MPLVLDRDPEGSARYSEHVRGPNVPNMRYIVELGHNRVQQFRSSETVLSLQLRTEVTENDHGRHLWPNENRSDEQLKVR